jgi:hypothetical protein
MVAQRFSKKWPLWLAIVPPPPPTEPPPLPPTEPPPPTEVVYPDSSTAAEMIAGTGGYDYGEPVANSIHTQFGVNCVNSCHMAPTLGWVDEADADSFKMTSEDGVENVAACNKCHPPQVKMGLESFNSTRFNRFAIGDYDGNGSAEGVQDEVQGLLDVLLEAIRASGVETLDHDPYWENVTTEAQRMAIHNWSFVSHDGSLGIHNTARSVQLLQRSYKDLTDQDVPGADPFSPVIVPKVEPSPVTIEPVMEIEGVVNEEGEPIRATALPSVGVGNYVLLRGFSLDISEDNPTTAVEWTLTPPEGSAAALTEVDEEHVYFVADAPGWYEVRLAVTDSKGTTTEGAIRINSAPYVGVGSVTGAMAPAPQCASCHPALAKIGAETAHASTFARKVDGGLDAPRARNAAAGQLGCLTHRTETRSERPVRELPRARRQMDWHRHLAERRELRLLPRRTLAIRQE